MNYLAHGYRFADDPYFLAGTALPDWLSVVDRSVRIRAKHVQNGNHEFDDPKFARMAEGVAQHHYDDGWFHQTRAFSELSWHLTVAVRDALPPDESMRPSFLGHILVELLLDAALIEEEPQRLEAYYSAIERIDGTAVEQFVRQVVGRAPDRMAYFLSLFSSERFLADYQDDQRLVYRLNQVLKRVRMPSLGDAFHEILPDARARVYARKDELMSPSAPVAETIVQPPE